VIAHRRSDETSVLLYAVLNVLRRWPPLLQLSLRRFFIEELELHIMKGTLGVTLRAPFHHQLLVLLGEEGVGQDLVHSQLHRVCMHRGREERSMPAKAMRAHAY